MIQKLLVVAAVAVVVLAGPSVQAADFDGNGRDDLVLTRQTHTLTWKIYDPVSTYSNTFEFGAPGDLPIAADYDGDGKADPAVFRPSTVTWYIFRTQDGPLQPFQFGTTGDIPVPADWDGDGKADIAIFRPSTATWYRWGSTAGPMPPVVFGYYKYLPMPADYDGDGVADFAVVDPVEMIWYRVGSSAGPFPPVQIGSLLGDIPLCGNYDTNPGVEMCLFRVINRMWLTPQGELVFPDSEGSLRCLQGDRPATPAGVMATIRYQFSLMYGTIPKLTVENRSLANDAAIIAPNTGEEYAEFRIVPADSTRVMIVAGHSGKILDVLGASTAEGARVVQHDYLGGNNQLFEIEPLPSYPGDVMIRATHSGKYLTGDLKVPDDSLSDFIIVQRSLGTGPQVFGMGAILTY